MKTITLEHLEIIARREGAEVYFNKNENPVLDFGGYGFEATEILPLQPDIAPEYYGFRYIGPLHRQKDVIAIWNELTEPVIIGDKLTVERAKELIGKTIEYSYRSYSGYQYKFIITITGIREQHSKQIGQDKEFHLEFIEDGIKKDYIYEWQNIFRISGNAYIVFVERIIS